MYRLFLILSLYSLVSCNSDNKSEVALTGESIHPYAAFFYNYDTLTKVYRYRDIKHGLAEQFHRVYGVEDSEGKHIIVERYSQDGRLTEALNYNLDSLNVIDHMVVNGLGENEKATLYKNNLLPFNSEEEVAFASKFSGFVDSTLMLLEKNRVLMDTLTLEVFSNKTEAFRIKENASYTLLNPFTEKEQRQNLTLYYIFAKGFGLVEWYDEANKSHYKLEEILSQDKWIKMLTR